MISRFGRIAVASMVVFIPWGMHAQYRTDVQQSSAEQDTTVSIPAVLTLEQALQIALSENETVKVADMEIEKAGYAKKGTYASLIPTVDASGSFMRTIKKQVMYMDFDMSSLMGGSQTGTDTGTGTGLDSGSIGSTQSSSSSSSDGIEMGRWNTFSGGVTASMPLVNFQLWESLKISDKDVELAVEKARSSRLDMVTQVKQAFYGVLLAKEAFLVYKDVYDNAIENFNLIEKKYNVQKASELEYTRAKSNVASAIPNVYNAESSVVLALWQLKAVMGIDLDQDIDVAGCLDDYAATMFRDIHENDDLNLDYNTTMRQLAIQAEELASNVKIQKAAYLPSLALSFSYSMNASTNDFNFSEYKWSPYSYAALSLSIPIFSGGKRLNSVRQASVQASELDIQKRNTERQLKIAIRQYVTTMETNMKSFNSAQEAVDMAQKAYDISEKSYQLGKGTITDLNDAQLGLTQSKLQRSQAVYNFVVAKSNLEQMLGHDFIAEDGSVDLEGSYAQDRE